jgi:hypothetical protein
VAGAQYITNYVPPADPTYRGPYLTDRYSAYRGPTVQGMPYRTSPGYFAAPYNDWRGAATAHRAARYFYYPNYPGLNYAPPPARRPVISTPPQTYAPHHDPFYEEHFWEDVAEDRDVSDYWGW